MQREVRERKTQMREILRESNTLQPKVKNFYLLVRGHWTSADGVWEPCTCGRPRESKLETTLQNEHQRPGWALGLGTRDTDYNWLQGPGRQCREWKWRRLCEKRQKVVEPTSHPETRWLPSFGWPDLQFPDILIFLLIFLVVFTMKLEIWLCMWHGPVFRKLFTVLFCFFSTGQTK